MAALTPPEEQAMVSTLRASAPKAKAKPLDHARAMKGDPRDPRADAKTWPCMGRHVPGPPAANNHGQWQHCARCDYRMSYIPRHGSKGQFTAVKNPEMVARALRELRPLMGDFAPTAAIVRAMQAKVDAEEVLRIHIRDLQANYTELQGTPQPAGGGETYNYENYDEPYDADLYQQLAGDARSRDHSDQSHQRLRVHGPATSTVAKRNNCRTVKPVSVGLGNKVMNAVTMLATMASTLLVGLHLHERDGLWELSCSPHTGLSMAAEQQDLRPRRINLSSGYDLYRPETWDQLRELRRQKQPRKLWFSLPYTKWCPWNDIDHKEATSRERLETGRRKERRMLWFVNNFIKESLAEDDQIKIYFEWPTRCYGWNQHPMMDLWNYMDEVDQVWLNCRVDSCRYGLKDESGEFVYKRWSIRTNDENFHRVFRAKVCTGNHYHSTRGNHEGKLENFYPWSMVQSIVRHWRNELAPTRHLRLLSRRDVLQAELGAEDQQHENYVNIVEGEENDSPRSLEPEELLATMKEADLVSLRFYLRDGYRQRGLCL